MLCCGRRELLAALFTAFVIVVIFSFFGVTHFVVGFAVLLGHVAVPFDSFRGADADQAKQLVECLHDTSASALELLGFGFLLRRRFGSVRGE